MTPEEEYEYKKNVSIVKENLEFALGALSARSILDKGYLGHARKAYMWQASELIPRIETALRIAALLPLHSKED